MPTLTAVRTCIVCGTVAMHDSKDGVTCGDSICASKLPEVVLALREAAHSTGKEIDELNIKVNALTRANEELMKLKEGCVRVLDRAAGGITESLIALRDVGKVPPTVPA